MRYHILLRNTTQHHCASHWVQQGRKIMWHNFVRAMDINSNFLMSLSTYGHVFLHTHVERMLSEQYSILHRISLWILNTGTMEDWGSQEKVICLLSLLLMWDFFSNKSCCMHYKHYWKRAQQFFKIYIFPAKDRLYKMEAVQITA